MSQNIPPDTDSVDKPPSFTKRHKLLFGVIIAVSILLYAAFNVWVWQVSTSSKTVTKSTTGFPGLTGSGPVIISSLTPTPHPTGPGPYACDMFGVCNYYEDTKRAGCPKTYADRSCLNECENKDVWCTK